VLDSTNYFLENKMLELGNKFWLGHPYSL